MNETGYDELARLDDDDAQVADGEITEADAFEVAEADRETDLIRASKYALGFLGGVAALHGVIPDALTTMAMPVISDITSALVRVGWRRVHHAAETLADAAEAADLLLDEFVEKAVSDDHRQELLARTLNIAQDTARRDNRRALGRALAAGVMGNDSRVDEELLFARAIDGLTEMHVRALAQLADGRQLTTRTLVQIDPGLERGAVALLSQLLSQGLVDSRSPVTPGGAMTPEPIYYITDLGREFLYRLPEDPG
jgi:hypothetical protein